MNLGRAAEPSAGLGRACRWPLGNQREDNELQSDQGSGGRPDDDVEAVPLGEFGHDEIHSDGHFSIVIFRQSSLNRSRRYANSGPPSPWYASWATSRANGSV
jgi:hypothetical protein